jgi:hypothetical protein
MKSTLLMSVLFFAGCATPGTRPRDMTAFGHEIAAEAEGRAGSPDRAAEHRTAAKTLREMEESACAGLPTSERDQSPLLGNEAVISAVPLWPLPSSAKGAPARKLVGASMVLRAERGVTAEWLQRVVDCHVARNALGEGKAAAMRDCPLAVTGISAVVRSTGTGFAVEIAANDPGSGAAEEVLRRASKLVREPSVTARDE